MVPELEANKVHLLCHFPRVDHVILHQHSGTSLNIKVTGTEQM